MGEAAEMGRIMSEAANDCLKSGITVKYKISEVSYYEFLSTYGPALTCGDTPKTVVMADAAQHGNDDAPTTSTSISGQTDEGSVDSKTETESELEGEQVTASWKVIEQKDEELKAKDEELTAHQ